MQLMSQEGRLQVSFMWDIVMCKTVCDSHGHELCSCAAMTREKHLLERVDQQYVLFGGSLEPSSCVEGVGLVVGCPTCSISSFTVCLMASIMLVFDS